MMHRTLAFPQGKAGVHPASNPEPRRRVQSEAISAAACTGNSLLGNKIVVYESKSDAIAKQQESAHATVSTLKFYLHF